MIRPHIWGVLLGVVFLDVMHCGLMVPLDTLGAKLLAEVVFPNHVVIVPVVARAADFSVLSREVIAIAAAVVSVTAWVVVAQGVVVPVTETVIPVAIAEAVVPIAVAGAVIPVAEMVIPIAVAIPQITSQVLTVARDPPLVVAQPSFVVAQLAPIFAEIAIAGAVVAVPQIPPQVFAIPGQPALVLADPAQVIAQLPAVLAEVAEMVVTVPVAEAALLQPARALGPFIGAHLLQPVDALSQFRSVDALLRPATDDLAQTAAEGRIARNPGCAKVSQGLSKIGSRSKRSTRDRRQILGPSCPIDYRCYDDCCEVQVFHGTFLSSRCQTEATVAHGTGK